MIVGDGKVGQALTGRLAEEGHDLVVIDSSPKALRTSVEIHDVMGVNGNGASYAVQKEAGVGEADLLIAATSGDELNLLCCLVAKKLGARHTIARVRNPDYADQLVLMKEELGLSMTVNPELAAAREIARMLRFPSALKLDSFARGQVELVEIKVKADSPLLGQALYALSSRLGIRILICAVRRGEEGYIPTGDFVLQEGDKITITASPSELDSLFRKLGIYRHKIHRVMVVGGGMKIFTNYHVVAMPKVGIYGAPLGNILCFGLCLGLDLVLIARVIPRRPRYLEIFLKPFLASALMGGAAWAVYGLGSKLFFSLGAQSLKEALASGVEPGGLGARLCVLDQAAVYGLASKVLSAAPEEGAEAVLSRSANALCTLGAIGVAVVVYGVLVVALRAISRDDLSLMPKGDKIARLLRL